MEFHSSREERLSQASKEVLSAYEKREKIGFFKRNPRYKIWLMDLILIVVFTFFIIPAAVKASKRIRLDEYKVESGAFIYDQELFIRLKILNTGKSLKERKRSDTVSAVIKSNTGETIGQGDEVLPHGEGEAVFIRFNTPFKAQWTDLEVTLTSGELKKVYKIGIEKEENVLK